MNCPQCGQEVVREARFCSQCGQQLKLVCPGCGVENTAGSRFCFSCGRSLTEPSQGERVMVGGGSGAQTQPRVVGCPRCFANNEPGSAYCFQCGLPFEGKAGVGGSGVSGIPAYVGGHPGGFWLRLLAAVLDGILLWVAVGALSSLFLGQSVTGLLGDEGWDSTNGIEFVIDAFYYTVMVALWATTVGKRVFGMHVVRRDGSRVGIGRAFARYLAYGLSAVILGIGFLMIGLRQDKRGLHDLICDTVVVRR